MKNPQGHKYSPNIKKKKWFPIKTVLKKVLTMKDLDVYNDEHNQ